DGQKVHAEAVAEHKAVEHSVMPDVRSSEIDSPQFAGRVKVFGEMISHHAKEEEKTMFKMARELFSTEERAELDEQYEAWKKSEAGMEMVAAARQEAMGRSDQERARAH